MRLKTWLPIAAAAALALAGGCEKAQTRKTIVLNPTTRQAPPIPDVDEPPVDEKPGPVASPSTTQKVKNSFVYVNGVRFDFPVAKLILHPEGDKVRAMLCSNDPPEVISPTYQGNRYSFEMTPDGVDNVKNIAAGEFVYRAPSQEPQETPNGIFLEGDREHLQPYDIRVVFEKKGDQLVAEIQGTFIRVTKGNRLGELVGVMATLPAKPEIK